MRLTTEQIHRYQRDGFLTFLELIDPDEVVALTSEVDRLTRCEDTPYIRRERSGALRTITRLHEEDGVTASPEFRALSRQARLLQPAQQLLDDDELYIFHTKLNLKPAFVGTIWGWHQDYATWQNDGIPTPNMVTALVMLDEAEEISGALYVLPGSHRSGVLEHVKNDVNAGGALNVESLRSNLIREQLKLIKPVPVLGPPGTVTFFHPNLIHGSGHNISANDRRQMYIVYNTVMNKSRPVPNPRPEHVRSLNFTVVQSMPDDAIRVAARARRVIALQGA